MAVEILDGMKIDVVLLDVGKCEGVAEVGSVG